MSIPAIIYLVLTAVGLLLAARLHGYPRQAFSFWSTLWSSSCICGLLYWGGFFS